MTLVCGVSSAYHQCLRAVFLCIWISDSYRKNPAWVRSTSRIVSNVSQARGFYFLNNCFTAKKCEGWYDLESGEVRIPLHGIRKHASLLPPAWGLLHYPEMPLNWKIKIHYFHCIDFANYNTTMNNKLNFALQSGPLWSKVIHFHNHNDLNLAVCLCSGTTLPFHVHTWKAWDRESTSASHSMCLHGIKE